MLKSVEQSIPHKCATCAYFGQTPPKGTMPGVTLAHRKCLASSLNPAGWRNPNDWCFKWMAKDENKTS